MMMANLWSILVLLSCSAIDFVKSNNDDTNVTALADAIELLETFVDSENESLVANHYDMVVNETKADEDKFRDYFVHRVSGFHDNDDEIDEEGNEDYKMLERPIETVRAPYLDTANWKKGWRKYPLYIIILGGFRWDFLTRHRYNLTSFLFLKKHGTSMSKVTPVFPSEDYPVWTSIATGLYPEGHNIIGDIMFDLKTREFFNRVYPETTRDREWWKEVKPFWSEAAKHGRKVTMLNWHDCQLPGLNLESQQDCKPHKLGTHIQSRPEIARLFDTAFSKLYNHNYDVAVVYTDAIRRAAEIYGVHSAEMYRAMHDIDDVLQTKLIDIKSKADRGLIKMNLMVISDYGMSDAASLEPIFLDDYLALEEIQFVILSAGYAAIIPYALTQQKILNDCNKIEYGVDVFLANHLQDPPIATNDFLPEELRYGQGEWSQDILLVTKPGYQLVINSTDEKYICVNGSGFIDDEVMIRSGYNPYLDKPLRPKIKKGIEPTKEQLDNLRIWTDYQEHKHDMHTMAFAWGPDFQEGHAVEHKVQVVDFYQIFCFLLRIPTGFHDGSWDRISEMLTISATPSLRTQLSTTILGVVMTRLLLIIH